MAVVWLNSTATSSISFNTISIWSTWDDDNNQEIPLGRLPQSGDYVYANGYTCLIPTGTLNLGTAILSNGDNPYTGRNGGTFFFIAAGSYNITANIEHFGFSVVLGSTSRVASSKNRQLTLQGNVISFTTNGTFAIKAGGSNGRTVINGNLDGEYCLESDWGNSAIIINGNVSSAHALSFFGDGGGTNQFHLTINGNCKDNFVVANGQQQSQFLTVTISGNYTNTLNENPFNRTVVTFNCKNIINTGVELVVTTLNISGYIYYRGYNNKVGVRYTTLNILNPDTFTWKDVAEPRSNPFIILTDAEMNNRQQYPPENEVKQGTEYVWGEKVGTYQQPPESVVLKDYVYDGGEMVGTLDLPQAPTTSDIVTAIKNDSDLGGKINDITTNTENIKSDTENIISDTNIIKNITEDIKINTNNILSESSSINNKSDSIITALNNTSPQINDLWNRLNDVLTARLGQSVTVEILEEVLTSQLNNQ